MNYNYDMLGRQRNQTVKGSTNYETMRNIQVNKLRQVYP